MVSVILDCPIHPNKMFRSNSSVKHHDRHPSPTFFINTAQNLDPTSHKFGENADMACIFI